ncbi:MAG: hypothetical protein MAG581_00368 [Deltaproteobacteria bacterium]|nr:hypothetical protein [Deltaproteobacteria bacterium]
MYKSVINDPYLSEKSFCVHKNFPRIFINDQEQIILELNVSY